MRTLGLLLLSIWLAGAAFANDSAVESVGGAVRAMTSHPTVALLDEYVRAWVQPEKDSVRVECVFHLRNDGPEVDVLIGFPEDAWGDTGPEPFRSFHSFVNGEEIACSRIQAADDDTGYGDHRFWWTKMVTFRPGETKTIRDVYEAGLGGSSDGSRWFTYTLSTGANWVGPIGSCDLVVSVGTPTDSLTLRGSPAAHFASPGEVRWYFADSEPETEAMPGQLFVRWERRRPNDHDR